jgi:hypothetical protein
MSAFNTKEYEEYLQKVPSSLRSLREFDEYIKSRPTGNLLKDSVLFDYSNRQHIPYYERRYPIDENYYRTPIGEAQFQIDKREYEEAEREKFKRDKSDWSDIFTRRGGKRRTRKSIKSRKARKARKSRRR